MMNTATKEELALVDERTDAVLASAAAIRLAVDNVLAAFEDDQRWVLTDNLRRLPQLIAMLHLASGRLLAAVDVADAP